MRTHRWPSTPMLIPAHHCLCQLLALTELSPTLVQGTMGCGQTGSPFIENPLDLSSYDRFRCTTHTSPRSSRIPGQVNECRWVGFSAPCTRWGSRDSSPPPLRHSFLCSRPHWFHVPSPYTWSSPAVLPAGPFPMKTGKQHSGKRKDFIEPPSPSSLSPAQSSFPVDARSGGQR